jgi:hypothetical protein
MLASMFINFTHTVCAYIVHMYSKQLRKEEKLAAERIDVSLAPATHPVPFELNDKRSQSTNTTKAL